MAELEEFGKVDQNTYERNYEETKIEWSIAEFSSILEDENIDVLKSPTFSFANVSWFLQLRPRSNIHVGYITLYIHKNFSYGCSFEFCFGLKNRNGNVDHLLTNTLNERDIMSFYGRFIESSELVRKKSELLPLGVLTVVVTLRRELVSSKSNQTKLIKLDTLSEHYENLFESNKGSDVTLRVRDKEYKAHKAVLIARSSVFAAMFEHEMSEKQTNVITIPDCDPDSFEQFLEFLYCGQLDILPLWKVLCLYETSDKYDVQELKTFCTECLIENLDEKNLCEVVILADKYDDEDLLSAVHDFFNINYHEIFEHFEWECLLKNQYRLANKLLKGMRKMKIKK